MVQIVDPDNVAQDLVSFCSHNKTLIYHWEWLTCPHSFSIHPTSRTASFKWTGQRITFAIWHTGPDDNSKITSIFLSFRCFISASSFHSGVSTPSPVTLIVSRGLSVQASLLLTYSAGQSLCSSVASESYSTHIESKTIERDFKFYPAEHYFFCVGISEASFSCIIYLKRLWEFPYTF